MPASESTVCGISFRYNRNNKGPQMDPCGTPHRKPAGVVLKLEQKPLDILNKTG